MSLKHNVAKAWSNIDVLIKQRHDELPKLAEVCKQYLGYERETLEKIMVARSSVAAAQEGQNVQALGAAQTQLRLGLGNLFALAEAYPDLKANANFVRLQDRITSLENTIADRREYYNESVNLNNVRIEQFPDVVIAGWLSFPPFALLEFGEEEKSEIDLKSFFSPS